MSLKYDFVIIGGGLSGCLLAARLASLEKEYKILLIEKDQKLGGQHTWSFHLSDIPSTAKDWFLPLVSKVWDSHSVSFPKYDRQLEGSYGSIRSKDLDEKLQRISRITFVLGKAVKKMGSRGVELDTGECFEGNTIIDARGFTKLDPAANAYQKFYGLTLALDEKHGLPGPVLMEATVEQIDGYRFVYLLPWTEKEVLIEDTYYSEYPQLACAELKERILSYAQTKGWKISQILEEESGVLPIPLFNRFELSQGEHPAALGVRAGLFHRTTGFSLPLTLCFIEELVSHLPKSTEEYESRLITFQSRYSAKHQMFCFLNRVLFWGVEPALRYTVLEQFYRLPEWLIARFYSSQMGILDWLLFFTRKPPVPIRKALQAGFKKRLLADV